MGKLENRLGARALMTQLCDRLKHNLDTLFTVELYQPRFADMSGDVLGQKR